MGLQEVPLILLSIIVWNFAVASMDCLVAVIDWIAHHRFILIYTQLNTMNKTEHEGEFKKDVEQVMTSQQVLKKMTPKDLNKISKQADDFKEGKLKFDTEISRWQEDEHLILSSKQNRMILLAKHMCAKLTDMIDFTCGQGPLNTTKDVVEMASQLSKDGNHLDRLAHDMMKQCPDESFAKKNVLAYLEQIPFYCNQLIVNA